MNKFKSGFFNGLGKAIYWFFQFFIVIFSFLTNIVDEIRSIILTVIGMGCIFIFFTPFLLAFFMKPVVFTLTIFFIGFPLLGKILVSFLKYEQFVTTEFLFAKAEFYKTGKGENISFSEYKRVFKEKEEEARRKRESEERKAQEEAYRRAFEEFFRNAGGAYYRQSYGGGSGQYNSSYQTVSNFKDEYEKNARILEVDPKSDKYEIKLAYRKMAKKYHPDLNKEEGATKKFQEINSAFEFFTDENIERYRKMIDINK
ncbi:DnaJ domain-containing protein [Citroniella saccharovorans]|uniref:DnaJ domain-containing protein n=2 Tax=Citroniella saccharovorans TaxID=2053367 RepID=UPI00361FACDB